MLSTALYGPRFHGIKNIHKLEGAQSRATKFFLKAKDSYETILSLENRRLLIDVTFTKNFLTLTFHV